MKDTDYIFPRRKITYGDLLAHKGKTMADVAELLGVSGGNLHNVMTKYKLHDAMKTDFFCKRENITTEEVLKHKGKTSVEVAAIFKLSMQTFRYCCNSRNIHSKFVWPGKSAKKDPNKPVSRPRNRQLMGGELTITTMDCFSYGCTGTVDVKHMPEDKPPRGMRCSSCKSY
jgi:hypothetical protein